MTTEAPPAAPAQCKHGCGKMLPQGRSIKLHENQHCPKRPSAPATNRARQPRRTRTVDPSRIPLERRPSNRPTMVWYFRPPSPNPGVQTSTGLPEDCFYVGDGWGAHHVDRQQRKSFEMPDGSIERVRLVCPVDLHDGMLNGVPVVALLKPDATPEAENNWERICELIELAREEEIELEKDMIAASEDDLQGGNLTPGQRTAARERKRLFETRVARLEAGHDFDALYTFFAEEARISQLPLRSDETRMRAFASEVAELGEEGRFVAPGPAPPQ